MIWNHGYLVNGFELSSWMVLLMICGKETRIRFICEDPPDDEMGVWNWNAFLVVERVL